MAPPGGYAVRLSRQEVSYALNSTRYCKLNARHSTLDSVTGRPAYQITRTDFAAARQYILDAIKRDEVSSRHGWAVLRRSDTPELLQQWCDDYLPPGIFKKLKNAVLAARKRSKKPKVGVDLTHMAHLKLSSLSSELELTLSETIITLEETYWLAVDAGLVK